jgi:hypothetical protein
VRVCLGRVWTVARNLPPESFTDPMSSVDRPRFNSLSTAENTGHDTAKHHVNRCVLIQRGCVSVGWVGDVGSDDKIPLLTISID